MQNRWGVTVAKGYWVSANKARNGSIEGIVLKIDSRSDYAKAYGAQVYLDSGAIVGVDDISESRGKMTVSKTGIVRQNPLTHVKITSKSQRKHISDATGELTDSPSARLRARRKKTAKMPEGVWANPVANFPYSVDIFVNSKWNSIALFKASGFAKIFAHSVFEMHKVKTRVVSLKD
jgi:hypothetical protein